MINLYLYCFSSRLMLSVISVYDKNNITRWLKDISEFYVRVAKTISHSFDALTQLVRYCCLHSNVKFISSRHRVMSSEYSAVLVRRIADLEI